MTRAIPLPLAHRAVLLLALLALAAGCSTRIIPPLAPANPVPVYVTDYGRHSSVVIPTGDGCVMEYTYGDWDFFALGHGGWMNAARALTASRSACLGRRSVPLPPDGGDLAETLGCEHLLKFTVAQADVWALVTSLDARYREQIGTLIYSYQQDLFFVKDTERYALFHNCNHETAEWLRMLGCEVRGSAMTSKFTLK